MAQTKLANMVNPEVMGQMITAGLPKAIKLVQLANIDTTLVGVPGDTITVPKYEYIGDATEVAEGEAIDPTLLKTATDKATVKKAGKGVEISDEAVLSGYGDPLGEAVRQLQLAIASKVDEDIIAALSKAKITLDKSSESISYAGIVDAVDKFAEEEDAEKVIVVHPNQISQLRKEADFIDKAKYGNDVMMTGEIGMIAGCRVVRSRRINDSSNYENYVIQLSPQPTDGTPVLPAIGLYLKRNVQVESDRDILKKTTVVTADEHYVAHLANDSKVVKVTFKKG